MRHLPLLNGGSIPVLGLGTWGMGEAGTSGREMVDALRLGIDLGMTLIDTAEMYGEGGAETLLGTAIAGRRDEVFLVSKVYPHNATRKGALAACERSLKRLGTDRLDLYLLHWRGEVRLGETLAAFIELERAGKIRHFGVSNFDTTDLAEWSALDGASGTAANQILYNLTRRGIEWDLLPGCRERGVVVMAYSPIEQGRLLKQRALLRFSRERGIPPAQLALAWILHQPGLVAIPKAAQARHVRENRAALDIVLTPADLVDLERLFPPPKGPTPLAML